MTTSPMFAYSSELAERFAAACPYLATYAGIGGHDHRWGDLGPAGNAAQEELFREARDALGALDVHGPDDVLARDVLIDEAERRLLRFEDHEHLYDLNNLASNFQTVPVFLDMMSVETPDAVDAVIARLEGVPAALETYRRTLEEGLATGHVVARRQVLAALEQGRVHASERSMFAAIAARAATRHPQLEPRLSAGARAASAGYAALCDWLQRTYLPAAPERDGVGASRYARAARMHLGIDIDLDEAYAWGWEEVHRIEGEMRRVAARIDSEATVAEVSAMLRADPRWMAPTAEDFVAHMQRLQEDAVSRLHGEHFDVAPRVQVIEVRLAPPGSGPLGAYYTAPTEDFSRPGRVNYTLEADTGIPWFHEVSTAYHEGFPGHHLHIATAVHRAEHLSRFQRLFAHNTGHAEGWALYAEQLMDELGFLDHPALVLGKLINEVVRAWRVVVDIGLHLELEVPAHAGLAAGATWSYALAVEAMRDRALLTHATAEGNVVRYLGLPGQAITYKLGQRVITDLREELRHRPGFTLPRFHDAVAGAGAMGLGLLQRRVRTALA